MTLEEREQSRVVHRRFARTRPKHLPGRDRSLGERTAAIGDDELGIESGASAQSVAGRASSIRAVEAEGPWLELVEADAAARAGVFHAEHLVFPARVSLCREDDRALAELEREVDALSEPRADAITNHETVDHGLNIVALRLRELGVVANLDNLAVNPRTQQARAADRLERIEMRALPSPNKRREHQHLAPTLHCEDARNHLLRRLPANGLSASRAMRDACACIE